MRDKVIWAILGILLAGTLAVATCTEPARKEPTPGAPLAPADRLVTLRIGTATIRVEVADDEAKRQLGLMHRDLLPHDRGMIFVFPEDRPLNFWMKNTRIPLSIAFISSDGRITEIRDMAAYDTTTITSKAQNRFALEANLGWFGSSGVKAGDRVDGLSALPPAME